MRNRIFKSIALMSVACALTMGGWILSGDLPAVATAADEHAHEEHAHDAHGHADSEKVHGDLDDLFGEEDAHEDHDDHADHDSHTEEGSHAGHGHDEHAEPKSHAGHAHEEHAEIEEDAHAGHGHDDHAGHGHGPGDGDCPEHRIPEAEDALCQSQLMEGLRPGQGLKVRLETPEAAAHVGVTTSRPLPAGDAGAALPGEVVFNRNRLARLTPLVPGVVKKVHVGLGDRVEEGQLLAEIASPQIAALRSELSSARSRQQLAETVYNREKDLLARGITSRQEYETAEAEWRQARSAVAQSRQQLLDYGVSPSDLDELSGSTLPVRAPFSATVAEIATVAGEAVSPGTALLTVADLSKLWIDLSVPEDRILQVRPGAEVSASFSALPGRSFAGKIFWVAPAFNEKTRMLQALAEVDNASGLLRQGLYGEVMLSESIGSGALAVPADALQSIDGAPYVFVELERDLFEVRRVEAGRRTNGTILIARGLSPEDRVVTSQGFALKSEILKSRLGASCADH